MTMVRRQNGEDNERLLRRFIKKMKKSGIIEEVLERRFYEKPSDKKRKEKARNINNWKREQRKLERDS